MNPCKLSKGNYSEVFDLRDVALGRNKEELGNEETVTHIQDLIIGWWEGFWGLE